MNGFPRRRELYDNIQNGDEDDDDLWRANMTELERLEETERQLHFTELYGPSLGAASARFAKLGTLPPHIETAERLHLARLIEESIANPTERVRENPVLAAIEAAELRTDWHYTPPEFRVETPLIWMTDPDDESDDFTVGVS